jgi:hypothetical protein
MPSVVLVLKEKYNKNPYNTAISRKYLFVRRLEFTKSAEVKYVILLFTWLLLEEGYTGHSF